MRKASVNWIKAVSLAVIAALFLSACGTADDRENNGQAEQPASPSPTAGVDETAGNQGEAEAGAGTGQAGGTEGSGGVPNTGGTGAIPGIAASDAAVNIIFALRQKDYELLKGYVHPDKGVLFSPGVRIDTKKAVKVKASQLPKLISSEAREWGTTAAGKPIKLTFGDYYKKYIYDKDYAAVENIGKDKLVGKSKDQSNIAEVFPDAKTFDYYEPGESGKTAWSSLILALEQKGDTWYLTGIVHNQEQL